MGIGLMNCIEIKRLHDLAKSKYDSGNSPFAELFNVGIAAVSQLNEHGTRKRSGVIDGKEYYVYEAAGKTSRPFLPSHYLSSVKQLADAREKLLASVNAGQRRFDIGVDDVNRSIYTLITSFSVCFDLWNPGARKTPGTFFEVLIGTLVSLLLPKYDRSKFIRIPNERESVSTDIVYIKRGAEGGLVIPTKITTRDRIVQPFAHQRILDEVFGGGVYKSVLVCVSELQRAGDDANEICVPGTVRLFQKHLSQLSGIYYLDPPSRYLQADVTDVVEVDCLGKLLTTTIASLTD
jgi:hypothetical protein